MPKFADCNLTKPPVLTDAQKCKGFEKCGRGALLPTADNLNATVRYLESLTVGDDTLRQELASPATFLTGAGLIGWVLQGVGAIPRTLLSKLKEVLYVTPSDFGADRTGATNTSVAMKAFYDHCIMTGQEGYIPSGTYKISAGTLFFDNLGFDKAFPKIDTAGHAFVTFLFDPAVATDEPMFVVTNGRAGSGHAGGNWTGGDGNYWSGGFHGGHTITDTRPPAGKSNSHGWELQGWTYPRFGRIVMNGQGGRSGIGGPIVHAAGSVIYLPKGLFDVVTLGFNTPTSNDPDPCAVSSAIFEGLESLYNRYTLENRNYVGFDGGVVQTIRGIGNTKGGIFGVGQGCQFLEGSWGICAGAVFDDGTALDHVGGAANRILVKNFEIDDCEFGIILNTVTNSEFTDIRFNHRYNSSFTPLNAGQGFWPRKCITLADGVDANISNLTFDRIIHRLQPLESGVNPAGSGGGPAFNKSAIGTFITTLNPNSILHVGYDHLVLDNPGFGFTGSDYYSGFTQPASYEVVLTNSGVPFFSSHLPTFAEASYVGAAPTISSGGFSGAGSIVALNARRLDRELIYNESGYYFTAPYAGYLECSATLEITAPSGSLVQMGFLTQPAGGGAFALLSSVNNKAVTATSQSHHLPIHHIPVSAGDKVFLTAATNAVTALPLTPSGASSAACWARYKMLGT